MAVSMAELMERRKAAVLGFLLAEMKAHWWAGSMVDSTAVSKDKLSVDLMVVLTVSLTVEMLVRTKVA